MVHIYITYEDMKMKIGTLVPHGSTDRTEYLNIIHGFQNAIGLLSKLLPS